MSVLVLAEHNGKELNPATLHAVTAAQKLGPVDVLICGHEIEDIAKKAAQISGINQVLSVDAAHYAALLAEEVAPLIVKIKENYRYFVAAATSVGKTIMPRVAALLDCSQVSDLIKIIDGRTFVRPIYAGNILATVSSDEEKLVLTVRTSAFEPAEIHDKSVLIQQVNSDIEPKKLSRFITQKLTQSERPELTQAKVIVSGGRAFGSAEQFDALLNPLADTLGAAIGASRAAVDAEYAPNDYQVGQTGKIVAPDLYFAIGISGAIQHVAGMSGSKTIVAINKDPDAQIFNVADYGIVGDLFEIVPQLTEQLKNK